MNKIVIFLLTCTLAVVKTKAQESLDSKTFVEFQMKYFDDIHGFYPDLEFQTHKKNIIIHAGYNVDALHMPNFEIGQSLGKISIFTGMGFHKQDQVHAIMRIHYKNETKRWEEEIYLRWYIHKISLVASEGNLIYKINHKNQIGLSEEIGVGKHFVKWQDVDTSKAEIEKLFLMGLTYRFQYKHNILFLINSVMGLQHVEGEGKLGYKCGIGLRYQL